MRKALTVNELTLTRQGPAHKRTLRISAPLACRRLEEHERGVVLLTLDVVGVCPDGAEAEPLFRCTSRRPKVYDLCIVPLREGADEQADVDCIKTALGPILLQLKEARTALEGPSRPSKFDRVYRNNRTTRKIGYASR